MVEIKIGPQLTQQNCGLIRKFEIGINIEKLQKELKNFLPKIEEIGWWKGDKEGRHNGQIAIHGTVGSNNPYHQSCGPQPDLAKDISTNPLTEDSFDTINDLFKNSYFEEIVNLFPIPVTRARIAKLNEKRCYRLHRDMTYKFHLPIITNPSNLFVFPEQRHRVIIHLPADGTIYYVDTSETHTFMNGHVKLPRYHMIFTSTLEKDTVLNHFNNEISLEQESYPSLDSGTWK